VSVEIPGLPPLAWTGHEGVAAFRDGSLELVAAAGVDWSNDATGAPAQQRATSLAFDAPRDFSLSARVSVVPPRSTFDAGALVLWADSDHWAKLCFEFSPQGAAMVVSVVTNDFSDDVNSTPVALDSIYLRIARVGPAWAMHSSLDGRAWDFVRLFRLRTELPVRVGFLAQAPLGEHCSARFDEIIMSTEALRGLRDGS
jgi:regulation of enolase protein 1 (concanavalin A-like superfamily)